MMIRDVTGTRSINPRYIDEIRIVTDRYDVANRIVAYLHGGGAVTLRQVNTYDVAGADAYISRQLELIEEMMNNA